MIFSSLQLAFLGDAVFELFIREYLLKNKLSKIKELKEDSLNFVTATKQAYFAHELINNNYLNENEKIIFKNGRNTKIHSKSKSCDIVTYKNATGFECLIGYLYLNDKNRLKEILNIIVNM